MAVITTDTFFESIALTPDDIHRQVVGRKWLLEMDDETLREIDSVIEETMHVVPEGTAIRWMPQGQKKMRTSSPTVINTPLIVEELVAACLAPGKTEGRVLVQRYADRQGIKMLWVRYYV